MKSGDGKDGKAGYVRRAAKAELDASTSHAQVLYAVQELCKLRMKC